MSSQDSYERHAAVERLHGTETILQGSPAHCPLGTAAMLQLHHTVAPDTGERCSPESTDVLESLCRSSWRMTKRQVPQARRTHSWQLLPPQRLLKRSLRYWPYLRALRMGVMTCTIPVAETWVNALPDIKMQQLCKE